MVTVPPAELEVGDVVCASCETVLEVSPGFARMYWTARTGVPVRVEGELVEFIEFDRSWTSYARIEIARSMPVPVLPPTDVTVGAARTAREHQLRSLLRPLASEVVADLLFMADRLRP